MTQLFWIMATLSSHWRRNPVQLAMLLIGLALATALWSGVQAINAEAKASYARATAVLGGPDIDALRPARGNAMPQSVFVELRRDGYMVSPVVEGRIQIDGRRIRILGIEPISLPEPAAPDGLVESGDAAGVPAFLRPPWEALAAPETLDVVKGSDTLPPRRADPSLPPDLVVVDIGVAQTLLAMEGKISRLLLDRGDMVPDAVLARHDLQHVGAGETVSVGSLTESFHLNLSAFALLAFAVGLLIVRAAIGLAFEQRLPMFRTLRSCGVSTGSLSVLIIVEVMIFATIAGLVGLALGYWIAAMLLPDVSASLRGLYGVAVSGALTLQPEWILSGLAMALAGALAAAGPALWTLRKLPPLAAARPDAWRSAQARQFKIGLVGAGLVTGIGVVLYALGDSLLAGFAMMACALLAAALALPALIGGMLSLCARFARSATAEWLIADMRQQLSGLSLALIALLFALAANIGVSTMVGGFRETFLDWLDKRLAAEIYVQSTDEAQARAIDRWAEQQPEIREVLPARMADTVVLGQPLEVRSVLDKPTYREDWPLITAAPGAWDVVFSGEGTLVSEQAAIRLGLGVGDSLNLGHGPLEIVGIYADYGNTRGQVLIAFTGLEANFPDAHRLGTGLRLNQTDIDKVLMRLTTTFEVPPDNIIDQAQLKRFSRDIFEETFAITTALNVLTLLVAGIALFTSLLSLFDRRLPHLAPIWALGVSRRQLASLELAKTVILAALTALIAIPVGIALAWILVAVVNVQAFGWRLPLILYPGQWAGLALLSIVVAAVAAILPILRLARTAPARLLKVFADAR